MSPEPQVPEDGKRISAQEALATLAMMSAMAPPIPREIAQRPPRGSEPRSMFAPARSKEHEAYLASIPSKNKKSKKKRKQRKKSKRRNR